MCVLVGKNKLKRASLAGCQHYKKKKLKKKKISFKILKKLLDVYYDIIKGISMPQRSIIILLNFIDLDTVKISKLFYPSVVSLCDSIDPGNLMQHNQIVLNF